MLEFGMSCALVLVCLFTIGLVINIAKDINDKMDNMYKSSNIKRNIILKRGLAKWIKVGKDSIKCSKCCITFRIASSPNVDVDFCPHCGSLMTKEDI